MSHADESSILQKLVNVKKRRAEQKLAKLHGELRRVGLEAQRLQESFAQGSGPSCNFDAFRIAIENRFPERIARGLAELEQKRQTLFADIAAAEHELKVALHATRELQGTDRRQKSEGD
jgi:hypothetical protein